MQNVVDFLDATYKWPGIHKPFAHQKTTTAFLIANKRAFCFNEAGTGKTSSVIWAADYLMEAGVMKKVLIVCPLSIMYSAWQSDLFKVAMHRKVGVAYGSAEKRKKIIKGDYEFVIINYDGIGIVADEIKEADFDLVVIDEANAYKTATTQRWKTLRALLYPNTGLWLLTGTPAAQSPVDAFGLAKLVCPDRIPKFFTSWRDSVMYKVGQFRYIPKPNSKETVFKALQPAIRYTKNECLDLPDVMYQYRDAPLSSQQQKYYVRLKNDMLVKAAGEEISAVNAAAMLTKLLQLSGGAVYTDSGEVLEFDIGPRLKVLKEVLDEASNKILIFVPYRHTIKILKDYLNRDGYSSEIINGEVSASDRASIFQRFQSSPDPHILIIQPQAASHGVTLTAADTIVFWSPVMSVETYIQCIARIDRVGQKNKMTVVHLEGSEVERRMYKMLEGKIDIHEKLVDLYQNIIEEV
jgi:SNF2 family DNA or RNA helicase